MPIARSQQPRPGVDRATCAAAVLACALGASLLVPASARADCVRTGDVVTCTGVDPNGFPDVRPPDPDTDDGLQIEVESGAVVENSGAQDSLELLFDNDVVIQANGAVTADDGAAAISGVSDSSSSASRRNTVDNAGSIIVQGSGGRGVDLGDHGAVTNRETGRVIVSGGLGGSDTVGIQVGPDGNVDNLGLVRVTGASAVGIRAVGTGANVDTFSGSEIVVEGANAVGVDARDLTHRGSATISGDGAVGLRVRGIGTNDGSLEVDGDDAIGMQSIGAAQITNNGSVRVVGDDAIGMQPGGGGLATNRGQLEVQGSGAVGLFGPAASFGTTRLGNEGTVLVTGTGATGAVAEAGAELDNSGLIDASGPDGVGVRLDGSRAAVTNGGTIRGGEGSGVAVWFADPAPDADELKDLFNEEAGVIEAASGLAVRGGGGRDRVVNRGEIQGDVLLGGNDDAYSWGDRSILGGALDGGDGLDVLQLFQSDPDVAVNDSFDLGTASDFEGLAVGQTGDTGTWTLTGSGSFSEGIVLVDGDLRIDPAAGVQDGIRVLGGRLQLDDGVSLPAGVQAFAGRTEIVPGATVDSDLELSDAGVLGFDGDALLQGGLSLDGATLETRFDSTGGGATLSVEGDLLLGPGSVLALQQSDAGPVAGEPVLRVLSVSGARTGSFDDVRITSADPFLRAITSYGSAAGANVVDVQLTSRLLPFARSRSEQRIAGYLDGVVAQGPNPELQSLLDSFAPLTNAELPGAFDALHGAVYDAHTSTAFSTATRYLDMLATRPLRCEELVSPQRRDRPSRSPCGERGLTPWVHATGAFVDRDGDAGAEDWSSAGGGFAFGVDQRLAGAWILSGLVGSSRSALDLNEDGDGSYTSFEAGVAAAWSRGGTHLRAAVGYGHGWHTTHRRASYPGYSQLALADHESDRVSGRVEVGHSFVSMPFEIEPLASVEYSWLHERAIDETNGGPVRLAIAARDNVLLATDAGLRAGVTLVKHAYMGSWLEWADGVWRPAVHGGWRQLWNDYDRHLGARLRSAPAGSGRFRVRSEDAQYGGRFGAGVSFQPQGTRNHVEVGYDAFLGDGTTSHAVMARLRIPF